jgi:Carbohydrate family 9 binding domain-like
MTDTWFALRDDSMISQDEFIDYLVQADECLNKRPVNQLARFGRWCQRRPALAPMGLALMLVTLLGFAGVVWQLFRAEGARSVAVQEKVRARSADAYIPPKGYVCYRTSSKITVDGRPDEPAWQAVPWTDDFVDIEGDRRPPPRFRTRTKMLWDSDYFYIAAELDEPHLWATLTEHDSVIFHDNDFEVFIDPDGDNHNYAEFEINALNTGWDLLLPKPYKDGGRADNSWEIPGLKTAVRMNGTLNDPHDTDRGWTVELAFPWRVLGSLSNAPAPPRDGDQWRVNFSRVEWRTDIADGKYRKVPNRREDNWVWSPQRAIDMHWPETWGYVQFSTAPVGTAPFRADSAGPVRHLLHRVYYAQRKFQEEHGHFAQALGELDLPQLDHEMLASPLTLEVAEDRYDVLAELRLPNGNTQHWHIRNDSRIWKDINDF